MLTLLNRIDSHKNQAISLVKSEVESNKNKQWRRANSAMAFF